MKDEDRMKLLQEKVEVDDQIRNLKIVLEQARQRVQQFGRYMDPVKYRQSEMRIARLRLRSQELQHLLGMGKNIKKLTLPQVFMSTAEEMLPEDLFNHIIQIALGKYENQNVQS